MADDAAPSNEDQHASEAPQNEPEEPFQPVSTTRSLRMIAQQFSGGGRQTTDGRPATKEIVNGLDHREYLYGWIATGFAAVTGVVAYFAERHAPNLTERNDAFVNLIAVLIAVAGMTAGTAFRRRALLGFGSFLAGLILLSSHAGALGVVWLGFGFWLIMRVLQRQRQERDAARATRSSSSAKRSGTSSRAASTPVVKASKRYTPPRRTRSASSRRR